MSTVPFAVSLVTSAFILFIVLCNPALNMSFGFLSLFLLALNAGLVWMVVTVLKHGRPSGKTFDEAFFDDINTTQ